MKGSERSQYAVFSHACITPFTVAAKRCGRDIVNFSFMTGHMQPSYVISRWRTFSGLLLAVFLLRVWIPAGYMPVSSISVPDGQVLSLSLCTSGLAPHVIKSLALDQPGSSPSSHDLAPWVCAYGVAVGQLALPTSFAALQMPGAITAVARAGPFVVAGSSNVIRGPPLGPRAPPR